MQSIKSNISRFFPLKEAGEKNCDVCGSVIKLYETPRGVTGACKECTDRALIHSLNLPKIEDLQNEKLSAFISNFEKVTSDIENATVRSYKGIHNTQLKAKQIVIDYINEFDGTRSLVLSGTPGLGKSHLAFATVKALRIKKQHALFIKSTHLLDQIKISYGNSGISEEQIFNMLGELDLLAIDDLGSEYVKSNGDGSESWASDILYKIFDMRIEKATICTTNYAESELIKKYGNNGPRIISRMLNKAIGIRLDGEDFRRKEAF